MSPDVLIWVTCHRYETYLPDAHQSVAEQSVPVACVVSHDACTGVNPIGTAANRNRGIEFAICHRFPYLLFLDADDVLPPNYVEELLNAAAGTGCVVACGADVFGEERGQIQVRQPITLDSLLEVNTVHVSSLISTSLLEKHGGFDPTLPAFEDWDLWCRLASAGAEFRVCDTTRLQIRRHSDSRHSRKQLTFAEAQRIMKQRYWRKS